MGEGTRTVDERGRVTIPECLRDRLDIQPGDEVVVREVGDRIVIEKPTPEERLVEGYRRRAERDCELVAEMDGVSSEADEYLDALRNEFADVEKDAEELREEARETALDEAGR